MSGEVQYCADLSGKSLNLELLKKLCACATMGRLVSESDGSAGNG